MLKYIFPFLLLLLTQHGPPYKKLKFKMGHVNCCSCNESMPDYSQNECSGVIPKKPD